MKNPLFKTLSRWIYLLAAGALSFFAIVFMSFVGIEEGLTFNFPTTAAGWAVWLITKGIVVALSMCIFFCFERQGELNVRDDERYKKAQELLRKSKHKKEKLARSKIEFLRDTYLKKGLTLAITSSLSLVSFSLAILSFDYLTCISYVLVVASGIIFGALQMKASEEYFVGEYLEYAERTAKEETDESGKHLRTDSGSTAELNVDSSHRSGGLEDNQDGSIDAIQHNDHLQRTEGGGINKDGCDDGHAGGSNDVGRE